VSLLVFETRLYASGADDGVGCRARGSVAPTPLYNVVNFPTPTSRRGETYKGAVLRKIEENGEVDRDGKEWRVRGHPIIQINYESAKTPAFPIIFEERHQGRCRREVLDVLFGHIRKIDNPCKVHPAIPERGLPLLAKSGIVVGRIRRSGTGVDCNVVYWQLLGATVHSSVPILGIVPCVEFDGQRIGYTFEAKATTRGP